MVHPALAVVAPSRDDVEMNGSIGKWCCQLDDIFQNCSKSINSKVMSSERGPVVWTVLTLAAN
jgi:hypothetical protein